MTVFGIGSLELILILLVLILIFGPDRISDIGRNVGRAYRKFTGVTDEINQQVRQVRSAVDSTVNLQEISKPISDASKEIKSFQKKVEKEVRSTGSSLTTSISPQDNSTSEEEE